MKHCDDYELMIADVLSGKLDEQSASEFEAHLEICAECQASFERFERTALILNDAYPASSTENAKIWARVEESLGSKRAVSGRSSVAAISPWAPLFGTAAMVALAVLLFLFSPGAQKASTVADTQPSVKKDSKDGKDNRTESASKLIHAEAVALEVTPPITQPAKESNPPPSVALSVNPMVPDVAPEHVADPQPPAAATAVPIPTPPPTGTARGPREIIDDARGLALLRRTGAVAIFDADHQTWRPIVAGERVPYGTAVRTGAGALAELAFGESRVRLDEKTEVTIASAEARVAELSHGRLRVDLLRSERPFRIRSGGGAVELTGTVVDVDAPAPDLAFVRVLEGHVKVDQALSDSNSDRPALPVAIDHEALVAFRAPDAVLEALPQPVRSRALTLAHDRGHAALSDPNVKNWTDPLDHPPSKSDAAVGQLIVKDEQGHEAAPLSVARMDIEASVRGPESITKIDQSFLNTTDRTLEGTFYFPLPPGAAISRFAMYVDPKNLIEGEVVERGKARAIFNSILRQRRDPALLEWMEGNLFKARIFPIAPHSEKRVILEYTQLLPAFYDTRRYVFPLVSELTEKSPIGKLSIHLKLATGDGARFEEVYSPSYSRQTQVQGLGCANAVATLNLSNIKPNADFVLTFSAPRPSELFSTAYAEKDEQPYALLGYEPRLARGEGSAVRGRGTANGRDILFLVETSGTRSTQDLDAQRRVLESMLSGLDPAADRVALAAADIGITQLSNGFQSIDAADVGNAMQSLKQRVPLGGLDLGASLREASEMFGPSARKRMILFVGAGVPALGTLDSGKLAEEVSAQLAHTKTSFTAVAIGRSVESLTLSELARRSGGFYVPLKVDEGLDEAAFQLGLSLQSPLIESPLLKSAGDTLSDIYPKQLGSLLPGQEVFVHGRLPLASSPRDAVHLSVSATLNGAPFARNFDVSLPRHLDADPAVGRFWARARLDFLLTQPQSEAQRHEVINLAQTWTLMSPYTSFLVLESNDDYKRYDIDRSKRRPAWKDAPIELEQPRIELAEKLSRDINELGRELGRPIQDQVVISSGRFTVDLTGKLNPTAPKSGGEDFISGGFIATDSALNLIGNDVFTDINGALAVPPTLAAPGLDGIWGTSEDTPFIPGTPSTVATQNRSVVPPHLHWKARTRDAAYDNNLILVGTREKPVNIDQQAVVKGDIIIKGYYTGAESLWAQGNIYLPSDVQYRSTSDSLKDSGKATGNVENLGGMIAGGTIIIGDYLTMSASESGLATGEPQDDVFKNVHYDLSLTPDTSPKGTDYADNGVYNFAGLFDPNAQKLKDVVLKQQKSVVVNPIRGKQAAEEKNKLERELNGANATEGEASYQSALKLYNDLEYEKAKEQFEKALAADPANEAARQKLQIVNSLLGIHVDKIAQKIKELESGERVKQQESLVQLGNALQEARTLEERGTGYPLKPGALDKDRALADELESLHKSQDKYKRVKEILNWMPPTFDLPDEHKTVDEGLARLRQKISDKEDEINFLRRKQAQHEADSSRVREAELFQARIKKLSEQTTDLYNRGDFKAAERLSIQILKVDPFNKDAEEMKSKARGAYHTNSNGDAKEDGRKPSEDIDEQTISYAPLLLYPQNWDQISRRAEQSALKATTPPLPHPTYGLPNLGYALIYNEKSNTRPTAPVHKRFETPANDNLTNSAESRLREEVQAQASAHLEAGGRLFNSFQYEEARKELELALQLDRTNEKARTELLRINDILGVRRDRIKSAVAQLYGEHRVTVQEKLVELDNRVDWAKRYLNQAQSDPDLSASERIRKYQQGQLTLERARELIRFMPSDVKVEEQNDEVNRLLTQTGKDIAAAETRLQEIDREEAAKLSAEHAASEKRFFEKKVSKMVDEASSLFEVGQFDEAVNLAKKITEIDPINPEAHSIIATVRERGKIEKRKFIDEEYTEQFELNREHADRLNIPHRDYLIYPDNWQEIVQRSRAESERGEVEALKKDIDDLRKRLSATSAPTQSGVERTLDNRYGPNSTVSETAGQNYYIKGHDAKIQYRTGENDGTALLALRTKHFLGTDYDETRHESRGRKEVALAAKDDTIRSQEALIAQEKADNDKLHEENMKLLEPDNENDTGRITWQEAKFWQMQHGDIQLTTTPQIGPEYKGLDTNVLFGDFGDVKKLQDDNKKLDKNAPFPGFTNGPQQALGGTLSEVGSVWNHNVPYHNAKTPDSTDISQVIDLPRRIPDFPGPELSGSPNGIEGKEAKAIPASLSPMEWELAVLRAELSLSTKAHADDKWKADLQKKLQHTVSFEFTETPFDEAINFIRTKTTATIIVDPGISAKAVPNVTLRVSDMSADLALRWIVKLADLDMTFRDHAVYIARELKPSETVELRIYDIADINTRDALSDLVRKYVQPKSWNPASGTSVEEMAGRLVVMQQPAVHEIIEQSLKEARLALAVKYQTGGDGRKADDDRVTTESATIERLRRILSESKAAPETLATRLLLYQKLASISSGVDAYRALADGIAEFKSEGPQAEALAHDLAQRIRGEQDAKLLDQILDTKSALVKQDKEQTHGPEAHATITDIGLRARIYSRRAELESDPAKRCEFCQRAYSESENDATYLRPLVESFLAGSQNQPAVKYIEESLRQGAAEPWMYPTLAKAYAALGDAKNSMRALTQDVALRPREAQPRLELAHTFDALGRGPEAVRELRAACEFAFESAAAHRELLAMAKKYHDNDAREWALLAMLGSMWLSQDGDVWGEARRDFDALNSELKDAGKFDHIKELASKRKIAEANDIVAVMKWDTDHTDIDLHVIEPGDQRVSYSSRTSFRGGMLDHDNTSGYGPETYTLKRGAPGHYLIKVHFYSGNVATNVNVIVTRRQGTPEESVQTFDVKLKHSGDEANIIEFDIGK